ncbi:MAG: hypothetical protein ACHQD9_06370, partial [Chitinophagales bacterium]
MSSQKKSSSRKSKAETALADFFLNEESRFVSFKQLKKKFGKRFHKNELYEGVHDLVSIGFLEERSNQFRHVSSTAEPPEIKNRKDIIGGVLDVTQRGHAYLVSEQSKEDVWIEKRNVANALDGDEVKVLLTKRKGKKPEGKVVDVVRRAKETFVGVIQRHGDQLFFKPDDKSIDVDFFIPEEKSKAARTNDKAIMHLLRWDRGMEFPEGEIMEVLGKAGAHETEMQSILIENGFRLRFPERVLKEAEDYP